MQLLREIHKMYSYIKYLHFTSLFSRLIYIAVNGRLSLIFVARNILLCTYIYYIFTQSSVDGHLHCARLGYL